MTNYSWIDDKNDIKFYDYRIKSDSPILFRCIGVCYLKCGQFRRRNPLRPNTTYQTKLKNRVKRIQNAEYLLIYLLQTDKT